MHSSMKFMLVSVFPDYGCSNSTCNLPKYFVHNFAHPLLIMTSPYIPCKIFPMHRLSLYYIFMHFIWSFIRTDGTGRYDCNCTGRNDFSDVALREFMERMQDEKLGRNEKGFKRNLDSGSQPALMGGSVLSGV